MTKQEARKYAGSRRKSLDEGQVRQYSREIFSRLKALPEFSAADEILTYVSCRNEVDTYEFIGDCLSLGKKVYSPKVIGKNMIFLRIFSVSGLVPGAFGIPEPPSESERLISPRKNAFMVMPGLAFDKKRRRAGYGGGFYDRFLAENTEIYKAAVGYDFQIVESIDAEEFDICPDIIITPSAVC